MTCGDHVFFASYSGDFSKKVDFASRAVIRQVEQNWNVFYNDLIMNFAIVGDCLLVMCGLRDRDVIPEVLVAPAEVQAGIYMLDGSDLSQKSHFQGVFESMKALDDGSSIVAIGRNDTISVFGVDNGDVVPVVPLRSFDIPLIFNAECIFYPQNCCLWDSSLQCSGRECCCCD